MYNISEKFVKETVNRFGFLVDTIKVLTGGSNHHVFSLNTTDNKKLIVKFPKIRETELLFSTGHKDTLFGGDLSLRRESYLLDLIRESGLPTPKVYGIYPTKIGDCIIVERSPGLNLVDYMNKESHSKEKFLEVIADLGKAFAKLHKTRFKSFGNIMYNSVIEPEGIGNFADRYLPINDMILKKCEAKGGLTKKERNSLKSFFDSEFEKYRERLTINHSPATLVITDMHGDNFFIEDGKISGFFDVESSQAAPYEYELYCLRFFVFNYYSKEEYALAEKHFWNAYSNGLYDFPDKETDELIDFFSACRLLELFQSYWGHVDGIRDTWGQRIKDMLFEYVNTKKVDYVGLGSIWRQRDAQPLHCSQ